jgi:hypothetical protein
MIQKALAFSKPLSKNQPDFNLDKLNNAYLTAWKRQSTSSSL